MSAALQSLTRPQPAGEAGAMLAFLLIGGGAALVFVPISALAVALLPFIDAWLVSALCYAAFIGPIYCLHRRFSFQSQAAHRQALPRYVLVQAMALLLATLFSYVFHGALSLPGVPAALLVIGLTSGVNYLVLRGWAFAFDAKREAVSA
ncbi:MAG: hypothetical protein ABS75_25705 [Pelagibacterium sp. SCN 63-23]|nr:MAG: hypothetical protein ABS75_25705 [Pelagibacterium sp. SCN 63-23]